MAKKNVKHVCRGFFEHYIHLSHHFSWLTNVGSLIPVVEANLYKQLGTREFVCNSICKSLFSGFMLQFLLHVDKGTEIRETLGDIDTAVETEYEGARTFKDVHILVML